MIVKTAVQQQWKVYGEPIKKFEVLTNALVDGKPFYTISCKKEVSIWIRENGKENVEWFDHIDGRWMYHLNKFDVSQEMLAMIKLRWS